MNTEKEQQKLPAKKNTLAEIKNKWWIPVAITAFIWGVISGQWWIPVLMVIVFVLTFMIMRKNRGPSYAKKN